MEKLGNLIPEEVKKKLIDSSDFIGENFIGESGFMGEADVVTHHKHHKGRHNEILNKEDISAISNKLHGHKEHKQIKNFVGESNADGEHHKHKFKELNMVPVVAVGSEIDHLHKHRKGKHDRNFVGENYEGEHDNLFGSKKDKAPKPAKVAKDPNVPSKTGTFLKNTATTENIGKALSLFQQTKNSGIFGGGTNAAAMNVPADDSQGNSGQPKSGSSNTTIYITIAVVVLAIVVGAYFYFKKK